MAITNEQEQRDIKKQCNRKFGVDLIQKEIVAIEDNKTFNVVDLPPEKKAIDKMWVYKYKYNVDGTMERLKSLLVVLENRQVKDRDFKETLTPVVKMTIVRGLLRVVTCKVWILHQMDVNNAFLHEDLKEEVCLKVLKHQIRTKYVNCITKYIDCTKFQDVGSLSLIIFMNLQ